MAKAEPAPVPDGRKVYLEDLTDEHGNFHPFYVDEKERSYFVNRGSVRYYHVGEHPDGTWIYRKER
jgi:hypothetical protein